MSVWIANINRSKQARGVAELFVVVSGSRGDAAYWEQHLRSVGEDLFGARLPEIVSVAETSPKGNFLGCVRAFALAEGRLREGGGALPEIGMMSMVFGKGQRLSPFTQALGNRKPALPTPYRGPRSGEYLRVADLSALYSNHWLKTLRDAGFRGLLVKWGDEALIPGSEWDLAPDALADVDAVRFVWCTEPTPALAREKEWLVIDPESGLMELELSRQPLESLQERMRTLGTPGRRLGVNLGSFAISYDFLEAAREVLQPHLDDAQHAADWDPYTWIALTSRDEATWRAELEHEARIGTTGLARLLERYPDFYPRIIAVRQALEERRGRPLRVATLDFGDTFWFDAGLHESLRASMEALTWQSPEGAAMRALFDLPDHLDERGNLVHNSMVPKNADIHDSVIVDSVLHNRASVVHGGVVVGGRHGTLEMPEGGVALFCVSNRLVFAGPRAVAFRVAGPADLETGDRLTTLLSDRGPVHLRANEEITDYRGTSYTEPIMGNIMSFEDAAALMQSIDSLVLEERWAKIRREADFFATQG